MEHHVPLLMRPTTLLQTVLMIGMILLLYGLYYLVVKIKEIYKKKREE